MEVTGATIDAGLQRNVPAKFMHQLTDFIYVTVPITNMANLIGAA